MDCKEPNTPEDKFFCFLVLSQEKLYKPFTDVFKDKLSLMQFATMAILKRYGLLTMGELADKMNMPKQQMTQIVAKLVEYGFASRYRSDTDRRMIRISTTPQGDTYIEKEHHAYLMRAIEQINALGEDDARDMRQAIDTMNRILPKLTIR